MPIKGARKLYKIPEITVGENAAGTGGRAIIAKIKEPVAELLGLTEIPYNDPDLIGTFSGTGPNAGFKYRKRLGGYRQASFKIVAKTEFEVLEQIRDESGDTILSEKKYKSISIGFPKGVSVREFVNWIGSKAIVSQVSYIVTPSGSSVPMGAG